ncbi:pyridoxamine 5'-phosphate oxidase-related, FMN binding protein [Saccharomonospora marina XMU15]|uniref:Pyridoxamine 5'-phosphate oxidase-related, FMN binding protein n=1 Tax=Saccharomonospora marina XMU15 TaxID=882083 RepID=H5XAU5_9PSEU|nr:pyridoxamine 5'-phosphate oxidase family protein [Saccharomonospora marina]EHR52655.1 pyridoxamine 5'-phosphate oxidase-related, FMN binding protein [Saccharomonospora marina XMU15]
MAAVYHAGERAVQERAGVLDQAGFSSRAIQARIPAVAQDFLREQVVLVLGATDRHGQVWACLLTGAPGFLRAEGDAGLVIDAHPVPGDPLHPEFVGTDAPVHVGVIAIEPASRRRMRMNGRATTTSSGIRVVLDQVYANCPKYIQKRQPRWTPTNPAAPLRARGLADRQIALISQADTFFIATADRNGNADASHRGGSPSFVEVISSTRLRWPDYVGNAMFATLGNIEVNPAAGLLFPDWETGNTLQLTGTARVDWDPDQAAAFPGAQRLVEFTITEVVEIPGASPLRWSAPVYSRFNPRPVRPSLAHEL